MSALCSTSSSATSATPASASYLRMLPSMSLPSGLRLVAPGEVGDDDCNGVGEEDNIMSMVKQQQEPNRKNKRKNFKPRNIRVLDDDDLGVEEPITDCDSRRIDLPTEAAVSPSPLDLSESAAASSLKRSLLWPAKVNCTALTLSDHLNHASASPSGQGGPGNSDSSDHPREDEDEDNEEEEMAAESRDPVDLTLKLDCDNGDMMEQDEDSGDDELLGEEDADEDSEAEEDHQRSQLSEAEVQRSLWLLHNQYLAQQQQQQPNKSSNNTEASMQDYAESTMKGLLSLYGLQRHDSAPLNHKVPHKSHHEEPPKSREDVSRSEPSSPRPSSALAPQANGSNHVGVVSNPPTPPHTPKLDPSLAALQAHMQSVLRAAAQENHAHLTSSHGSGPGPLSSSAASLSLPRPNSLERSCTLTPNMAAYMAMAASTSFAPPQQQLLMHGRRLEERGGGGGLYGGRKDSLLSGGGRLLSGGAKAVPIDYTRYVKRFSSALECGSHYCKDLNYREHFHCLDCNARVFVKKEEMIRHFKWHKKRDESLQHGFMRYSPMDDCSDRFRGCSHNRKQTHYHCLKDGCDKVYISTSDVQMHANYHRKDSAIIQEGFQRFRATEDCQTSYCAFNGQRTTHFHCRRGGCLYTFKNKADMEKHKTYHIKDEQLTKDGFKKFMKNETCTFEACRFSKVCNHIHCIRPGCNYVLHSSGQLYSHKRKHERRDNELAYRKYKLAQSVIKSLNGPGSSGATASTDGANAFPPLALSPATLAALGEQFPYHSDSSLSESFSAGGAGPSTPPAVLPLPFLPTDQQQQQSHLQFLYNSSRPLSPSMLHSEAALERKLLPLNPGQPCPLQCELTCQEHWHCGEENCSTAFRSRDAALDHVRQHVQQEQITPLCYVLAEPGQGDCPATCPLQTRGKHYHCLWEGCGEIILPQDKPFRRLDHFKMHEYTRRMSLGIKESPSPGFPLHPGALGAVMAGACPQGFTLDSVFRRKRGRPPKNRVIEVWNECMSTAAGTGDLPQAIFTSFKLPKPNSPPLPHFASPAPFAGVKSEAIGESNSAGASGAHASASASSPRGENSASPAKSEADAAASGRDSFYPIPAGSVCPDPFCTLAGTSHFHCAHPRCCSALESASALGPHVQQLHSQQDILEGFVYFDRLVDCRLPLCSYNQQEGHFHCVRPSCGLTFTKASVMYSHEHSHDSKSNENGESGSPRPSSAPMSNDDNSSPKTVKAAGTFYPIPAMKSRRSSSRDGSCSRSPSPAREETPNGKEAPPQKRRSQSPLALIRAGPSASALPPMEMPMLYGPASSCGRPFCKLKRREHYHCVVCNQAFSELERLQPHMLKHCSGALQWGSKDSEDSELHLPNSTVGSSSALAAAQQQQQQVELMLNGPPEASSPLPIPPPPYMPPFGILPAHSMPQGFLSPHLPPLYSGSPFSLPFGTPPPQLMGIKRPSPSPNDLSPTDAKKIRFPTSMRILKDEPVPEGYVRYRFNEDCGYQQCGYREHQTHFHCMRPDCGYSFCDKTRFVQHTARHERLDTLMGGDFAQYRAAVPCGRNNCLYTAALGSVQNKASHFHCLKCDFVCTDTNKVVAHRRQHQKTDSILAAGFEKFTPAQACRSGAEPCPHSTKQTHYHCLKCGYAVLGLSQMSAHKYRHMEGN